MPASYHSQFASQNQSASEFSRDRYGSAARTKNPRKGGVWRVVFIISIAVFVCALAALGAIGYQYWSQQNAYSNLEEYAEVDAAENEIGRAHV